jgi:N-acetylmuramoyl-L-alanine amidase
MKISNHQLYIDGDKPVEFRQSANSAGQLNPEYAVLHFTATANASGAIESFCNPTSKSSTHLVIDRDGVVTQLVPFNSIAWHAGRSTWNGLYSMNKYSIGIHLVNAGILQRKGDQWVSWWGQKYPNDQVIEAAHKNGKQKGGWHKYTDAQINVVREITSTLFNAYNLKDILGHEDISPVRKLDPGPAFPMKDLRSEIFGVDTSSEPVEERTKDIEAFRVFYSYAHEDEAYKDKLVQHLSILKRRGYIAEWHDRKIEPGQKWSKEISDNLNAADIILLMVSSDFINSDYCYEIEMKTAIERHEKGEAKVVPVILRPVLFEGAPFEALQMLPKDAKPVSKWEDEDEAFFEIAKAVSDLVVEQRAQNK